MTPANDPPVAPTVAHMTGALAAALRREFRIQNPRLDSVAVLERRPYSLRDSGALVLARAIRGDQVFSGDFSDELFCIFRTSPDENDIKEVVHCRPTPRWNDYTYRFERIDRDSIMLVGTDGYGFQHTLTIRWDAPDVSTYIRPEDPWLGEIVDFADTTQMNLYTHPGGAKVRLDLRYEGEVDFAMQVVEVRGEWFRVAVWVPSEPGCANDLNKPLRSDTLWTPFRIGGRRLLRRSVIGPC